MASKNKGRKALMFKMLTVAHTLWGAASGEATTDKAENCKFCEMLGCSAVVETSVWNLLVVKDFCLTKDNFFIFFGAYFYEDVQ
eukprot:5290174-Ditylum_brightwellii.AAC.1